MQVLMPSTAVLICTLLALRDSTATNDRTTSKMEGNYNITCILYFGKQKME